MILQLQFVDWTRGLIVPERNTVVVKIDGTCNNSIPPLPRAAWGVYFGPQSSINMNGIVDLHLMQSKRRAMIEALWRALLIIYYQVSRDYSLVQIFIVSDSEYLVNAMTRWIEGWIANNGRTNDGQRVPYFPLIMQCHWLIEAITSDHGPHRDVKFWFVTPEKNMEAQFLAHQALQALYTHNNRYFYPHQWY
ncbi:hypothetical protein ACO1O0_008813 [Amphichorda felina]